MCAYIFQMTKVERLERKLSLIAFMGKFNDIINDIRPVSFLSGLSNFLDIFTTSHYNYNILYVLMEVYYSQFDFCPTGAHIMHHDRLILSY